MAENILSYLADAYDVEVKFNFDNKEIVMKATHFNSKDKKAYTYELVFADCVCFEMNYTEEEDLALWDLTEGIEEMPSPKSGIRVFKINFADDDVVLTIKCRKFTMTRLDERERGQT